MNILENNQKQITQISGLFDLISESNKKCEVVIRKCGSMNIIHIDADGQKMDFKLHRRLSANMGFIVALMDNPFVEASEIERELYD